MIDLLFSFVSDYVIVRIDGNNFTFGNTAYGAQMATIEGLKLSKSGVIKEFPDLDGDEKWREKAIERFKLKMKSLPTEKMKAAYIVEDLEKYGYKFKRMQEAGKRATGVRP